MAFEGAMAWTSCPLTVADQIVFGADGIIVTCSFPTIRLTYLDLGNSVYECKVSLYSFACCFSSQNGLSVRSASTASAT